MYGNYDTIQAGRRKSNTGNFCETKLSADRLSCVYVYVAYV